MPDKGTSPHQPRFVIGIVLLSLGAVLLAMKLGVALPWHLWKYFPVPLIALGIWGLVQPSRYLDRTAGLWFLAAGLYCLTSAFNLFGLSWWSAWPIYVIAAGVSVMMDPDSHACAARNGRHDGDA